ncbi:MAG: phosphoserine phosphatase SerB [Rubritepida sp.]|nr:phosphoserine phosphatase SerB [Rubritepida sp.]
MNHALTLVADRTSTTLSPALIAQVREAVQGGAPDILSPGEAADIPVHTLPDMEVVYAALGDVAVDAIPVRTRGRRKGLLIADMDSTIVTSETLDELAAEAGLKPEIAAITARAMNGELDFRAALRARVAMLKGLEAAALERTWATTTLMPGARELVATMRAAGAHTALVSGGFSFFTSRVAKLVKFHEHHANTLGMAQGVLDGTVADPILDRDAKLDILKRLAAGLRLPLSATLAVGDGANDLPMLLAAGLGVAFRAKPVVRAQARAQVLHADLTALLFAQGFRRDEFVGS